MIGPSAGWLADYHDRALVILEPEEWSAWLDPAQDARKPTAAVRPERFELRGDCLMDEAEDS
jgi:putative SOS response-associated peptidase YedK